jgi:hypothetical protein
VVAEDGPPPVDRACDYARQAALALQHVHECGMVHRDVKPPNLLLAPDGTVKLLDLGLARLRARDATASASTLTHGGIVIGTPDYLAPEQCQDSHAVDIRADVYSLGCTLYFLLADQVPFPGGALMEKLLRHKLDPPQPVERLRPDVPGPVAAIVRKMMAKDREDRYATPAEVADALASWTKPVRPPIAPSSPAPPSRRPSRRGAIIGGLSAGAAAATAALTWRYGPGRGDPPRTPTNDPPVVTRPPPTPAAEPRWRAVSTFKATEGGAFDVAFDPKGGRLAVAGGTAAAAIEAGWAWLLDLSDGRWKPLRGHDCSVSHVAFSPDGGALVSTSGLRPIHIEKRGKGDITIWDMATGQARARPEPSEASLYALAMHPRGQWVAVGGLGGTVRLIDLRDGSVLQTDTERHPAAILALAVSRDGKTLACGFRNGLLRLRHTATLAERAEVTTPEADARVTGAAWTSDGRLVYAICRVTAERISQIRIADGGGRPQSEPIRHSQGDVAALALAPDDRTLATGTDDGTLRVWDLGDRRMILEEPAAHAGGVVGVAFEADGKTLASAGPDGTVRLWVR